MKPAPFDYERPKDLSKALNLMGREDAKCVAGSQSLGPMLNLRVVQPALLVDVRGIEELRAASEDADSVTLGACTTHAAIEDGRVPDPSRGYMKHVAARIAYRAVRNRGTVGGSLSHADPAADWPSALALLGGMAVIAGPKGRREVSLERFVTGLFASSLSEEELLVSLKIRKLSGKARWGYWKYCRKAGEFAQAIGAALDDPETGRVRAVVGAIGAAPLVLEQDEARALFDDPERQSVVAAARVCEDAYDRQLHAVALKRAVSQMKAMK